MKYNLVVRPEVDLHLLSVEMWYDEQRAGLGREFLQAVQAPMAKLPENPLLYHVRHRRKLVRWAYSRRFPFRIIFRVIDDTVVILAILHAARHDRHWQRRI